MNKHIKILIDAITSQLDGDPVPPATSKAFVDVQNAIASLQLENKTNDLRTLGVLSMGLLIDRYRGGIAAEQTMHAFIAPGRRQ